MAITTSFFSIKYVRRNNLQSPTEGGNGGSQKSNANYLNPINLGGQNQNGVNQTFVKSTTTTGSSDDAATVVVSPKSNSFMSSNPIASSTVLMQTNGNTNGHPQFSINNTTLFATPVCAVAASDQISKTNLNNNSNPSLANKMLAKKSSSAKSKL